MSGWGGGMGGGARQQRHSPLGGGSMMLTPGDFDTRRRLSAPCGSAAQVGWTICFITRTLSSNSNLTNYCYYQGSTLVIVSLKQLSKQGVRYSRKMLLLLLISYTQQAFQYKLRWTIFFSWIKTIPKNVNLLLYSLWVYLNKWVCIVLKTSCGV